MRWMGFVIDFVSDFPSGGTHLERYAQRFNCVEINTSFYRSHQAKTYRRWAASVPDGFLFSVKAPRTLTHERRLEACEPLLRAFLDEAGGLGDKLGCVLIQLPPSLALDTSVAQRFFAQLRARTDVQTVCEPRHASWFTSRGAEVLAAANINWVWADPAPAKGKYPPDGIEAPYFRLHGSPQMYVSSYAPPFIDTIADRMVTASTLTRAAWCIFDNTARGAAISNALALASILPLTREASAR